MIVTCWPMGSINTTKIYHKKKDNTKRRYCVFVDRGHRNCSVRPIAQPYPNNARFCDKNTERVIFEHIFHKPIFSFISVQREFFLCQMKAWPVKAHSFVINWPETSLFQSIFFQSIFQSTGRVLCVALISGIGWRLVGSSKEEFLKNCLDLNSRVIICCLH